jgi:hypothetical protein
MIVLVVFRVVGVVKADRFGDGRNVLFGTGKEMPTINRMRSRSSAYLALVAAAFLIESVGSILKDTILKSFPNRSELTSLIPRVNPFNWATQSPGQLL